MVKRYIPQQGDYIYIDFAPTHGHEQSGLRPALIISASLYNMKAGMMIVCPVTSKTKGYPFEVTAHIGKKEIGVILVDHVRNLDWQARKIRYIGKTSNETLREVQSKITALLA